MYISSQKNYYLDKKKHCGIYALKLILSLKINTLEQGNSLSNAKIFKVV